MMMRNYATYLVLALVASYPIVSESVCQGVTETQTHLNFTLSTVTTNNLEELGGELRFKKIFEVGDQQIDLVVTATDFSPDYGTDEPNGKASGGSSFGKINLRTKKGDQDSGSGTFKFCFVDPATDEKVKVDSFQWYVLYSM